MTRSELTHLDGRELSPRDAANIITRQEPRISYAPTTDGFRGWIKHPDPDARPNSKSYAIPEDEVAEKIKWALRNNYAVEYSNIGHSLTIFGDDYDSDGRPTNYYMKDSYTDCFYDAYFPMASCDEKLGGGGIYHYSLSRCACM